jgi:dTDP-4-dehydrorhamnose reductase
MQSPLIIGVHSTIGKALQARLRREGVSVRGTARRDGDSEAIPFDFTADPASWPQLDGDVAFLCAAATKLATCKRDPQATRLINVERMQALAERLQAGGSSIVFLSTNQVFDGRRPYRHADEPTSPLNEYGRQKAEFEHWLLSRHQPAAVLRLTKVIAGRLPMLERWQSALEKGEAVEAFSDLAFAPLPIDSVTEAMIELGKRKKSGIYQLSGKADVSYFDIARALAKRLHQPASLVRKASALEAGIPAEFLPRHGTLDRSTLRHIAVADPYEAVFV